MANNQSVALLCPKKAKTAKSALENAPISVINLIGYSERTIKTAHSIKELFNLLLANEDITSDEFKSLKHAIDLMLNDVITDIQTEITEPLVNGGFYE